MRLHDDLQRSMTALLHRAASEGQDVIPMLERGADPAGADLDGRRALHLAAMNGHTLTVISLSAYGADLNARTNNGRTALHGACWNGHTQTALQLVEMGADPHAKSFDGSTPVMDASRNGHHETVMSLVTIFGADVRAIDVNGRSSLHYAALNGHTEMVRNLVDLSAEVEGADNDGCRPLHFASWNGHSETASALLLRGADPRSIDCNFSTPLHDAALSGRTATAALLLDYKADVEARNDRGITPLHSAASSGHVETTKLLLECKADVNSSNNDGRSALHLATWNCHPRAVLLLLQYGANMLQSGKDGVPAGVGICHPDYDWPTELLPMLHSLRLPDSPMHFAAGHGDSFKVTTLASCGVDVNCVDQVGDTPLHRAVRNQRMSTTKRLVELGADVARSNDSGVTVDMDLMCFFDAKQQESVARKLREREALRARVQASAWAERAGVKQPEGEKLTEEERIRWALPAARALSPSLSSSSLSTTDPSLAPAASSALLSSRPPSPLVDALSPALSPTSASSARALGGGGGQGGAQQLAPSMVAHQAQHPAAGCDKEGVRHAEDEDEECKNPDDPSDCNPDDAHNLSAHHDQWAVHPVRRACMQVDAWVSHIPGVRVWQTSKQMGPLQAMLKKRSDLSESVAWRVALTVGELRAKRERLGRSVHHTCKLLGTVTAEIVAGDYKALASTLKDLPCSKRLEPWVVAKYQNTTTRCGSAISVARQTLSSASKVVREVVGGRPMKVPSVIVEEAGCIMETYRTGKCLPVGAKPQEV
mmetsp:Transcript_29815/g.71667  ORF Transcript_29815/g.71667 Transcript_29815/m.71667 type:complete len:768 (-) Transcript_29815:268-2571(-)